MWLRAVAAGGQGRYGSARADLGRLRQAVTAGPILSLAHSTQGSFLRQLGGHAAARHWDGPAFRLAYDSAEAMVDALLGLAADALGLRRLAASQALLARADRVLGNSDPPARLSLRRHWVAAELAMAGGDGAGAVRLAQQAAELAGDFVSARHQAKTAVVQAAAWCSAGEIDRARSVADEALDLTGRLGLIPLRWAVASLLADIGSKSHAGTQVREIRDASAAAIRRAGGIWLS